MHADFLGDSFDIVKRFWADRLGSVALLVAHPRFIPPEIRNEYEKTTKVPIFSNETIPQPFGLFLDPDTGIPLPSSPLSAATASHAPIRFIATEFDRLRPLYMLCFDQSFDRSCGLTSQQQRDYKRSALQDSQIFSFYYVSHAPFLFMARQITILERLKMRLLESGVPESRLEYNEPQTSSRTVPKTTIVETITPTDNDRSGIAEGIPQSSRSLFCPACGEKKFERWPFGWDAHAAHVCNGLVSSGAEERKVEFRTRFAKYFRQ